MVIRCENILLALKQFLIIILEFSKWKSMTSLSPLASAMHSSKLSFAGLQDEGMPLPNFNELVMNHITHLALS